MKKQNRPAMSGNAEFALSAILMLTASLLLTVLFWGPLWIGYGFVGGDLYPYFFPQKTFLADRLHAGEWPIWNNLTGFGYPILGESQTGAAYPFHLITYFLFNANAAYNVEHLLHYVICFVATWAFAGRLGLRRIGSALVAVVFTYGWFPPRACLEWAILTGAWLPVCLWCLESFLQTRQWRFAIGMSVAIGLQLLAGHFHLAFITQLMILNYGVWRIRNSVVSSEQPESKSRLSDTSSQRLTCPITCLISPASVALIGSVIAGFALASVQLLPAWELKTRSSRAVVGREHDPSYGHLPPVYLSQMIAPWLWYNPREIHECDSIRELAEFGAPWHWFGPDRNLDEVLKENRVGGLTTVDTNKVEAHLYCGLVPMALAVYWFVGMGLRLVLRWRSRQPVTQNHAEETRHIRECWFWTLCGIAAAVYATGWLLPVARYIPGFNFFRGPGRYGIITTLAIAILAGRGIDHLVAARQLAGRYLLTGLVFYSTLGDLWLVSRMVTYAIMVAHPAVDYREESPVRKLLQQEAEAPRLYAPFQNACNLLGVSCLPVYLGIAPSEYSDPKFAGQGMPKPQQGNPSIAADADFLDWLRGGGVTHLLALDRLDASSWRADLVWQGFDPMICRFLGRFDDPLYLYKFKESPGRASFMQDASDADVHVSQQRDANHLEIETMSPRKSTLLVRELSYPGWQVSIDDRPGTLSASGLFRSVDVPEGNHHVTFRYRPWSVGIGLMVSMASAFLLASIAHVRFWHLSWTDRLTSRIFPGRST